MDWKDVLATESGEKEVGDHRRKKKDPTLEADLTLLIEPDTGGDPEGKRRLTRKSLRSLAQMLPLKESESGSNAVAPTVADSPALDSAKPDPTAAAPAVADSAPRDSTTPRSTTVASAIAESSRGRRSGGISGDFDRFSGQRVTYCN